MIKKITLIFILFISALAVSAISQYDVWETFEDDINLWDWQKTSAYNASGMTFEQTNDAFQGTNAAIISYNITEPYGNVGIEYTLQQTNSLLTNYKYFVMWVKTERGGGTLDFLLYQSDSKVDYWFAQDATVLGNNFYKQVIIPMDNEGFRHTGSKSNDLFVATNINQRKILFESASIGYNRVLFDRLMFVETTPTNIGIVSPANLDVTTNHWSTISAYVGANRTNLVLQINGERYTLNSNTSGTKGSLTYSDGYALWTPNTPLVNGDYFCAMDCDTVSTNPLIQKVWMFTVIDKIKDTSFTNLINVNYISVDGSTKFGHDIVSEYNQSLMVSLYLNSFVNLKINLVDKTGNYIDTIKEFANTAGEIKFSFKPYDYLEKRITGLYFLEFSAQSVNDNRRKVRKLWSIKILY